MIDINEIREELEETLPPLIARTSVFEYTGGAITARTMKNYDCNGLGPEDLIRVGNRKIVYPKESFINWFISTLKKVE